MSVCLLEEMRSAPTTKRKHKRGHSPFRLSAKAIILAGWSRPFHAGERNAGLSPLHRSGTPAVNHLCWSHLVRLATCYLGCMTMSELFSVNIFLIFFFFFFFFYLFNGSFPPSPLSPAGNLQTQLVNAVLWCDPCFLFATEKTKNKINASFLVKKKNTFFKIHKFLNLKDI